MRTELLDRFPTIGRFCDHGHIGLNSHQTGDPLAHEWMVIDRENSNRRATTGQEASPFSSADIMEAESRDHQERLRAVA
jgi:hypothetical protein